MFRALLLRCLLCAVATSVLPSSATTQTVSPAVIEYTGPAESSFEVVNDTLLPLIATIEPKSFTIDVNGTAVFQALDPKVHLELNQTSLRLPPQQHRTIYYKVSANSYPAWFTVYVNFSGLPRRNGMNVKLSLPHTVYLLAKRPVNKSDLQFQSLQVNGLTLDGVLRNNGADMIRVLEVEAAQGKDKISLAGFPLLPNGERRFQIALHSTLPVTRLRARGKSVTLEQTLP